MAGYLAIPSLITAIIAAGLGDPEKGAEGIIVELFDQAGIASETLAQARNEVSRIYNDVGVEIIWTDAPVTDAGGRFVVHLMIRTTPPRPRMMGYALGDSRGTGGTAFVYRDRVADVARARDLDVATLLAHSMAHEIGHLLLPSPSHGNSGIMNANWDGQDFRDLAAGVLRFTTAQANAIRARVSETREVARPPSLRPGNRHRTTSETFRPGPDQSSITDPAAPRR